MGGHLPHPSPLRWDKSEVWSLLSPGGFFTTEPPGKPYNTSVHLVANLKSFVLLHVMFFVFFFNMETLIIIVSGPDLQRDWGAVEKQC